MPDAISKPADKDDRHGQAHTFPVCRDGEHTIIGEDIDANERDCQNKGNPGGDSRVE